MQPDNLEKAIALAPTIAKGLAAVGAVIPFTAIVKTMFGPAANEIAQMWNDQVKMWRFERQASCVKKAEKMLEDAGIKPHTVSPKLLLPLLEGASFEDNEDLHTMWAALLANAASRDGTSKVRPAFISALREMSADEAFLLNWIYDHSGIEPDSFSAGVVEDHEMAAVFYNAGFVANDPATPDGSIRAIREYLICLGSLRSSDFLEYHQEMSEAKDSSFYSLTQRGKAFVEACLAPKQKQP